MAYVNIYWHKNDSLVIRAYKDMLSAMVDSNQVNDLLFDKSWALYKNKVDGTNIGVKKIIKQELGVLADYKIVHAEKIEQLKVR